MNINDILTIDLHRNYSDHNVDPINHFEKYKQSGGLYKVYDKTIISYERVEKNIVEFHTSNAGTGQELVTAVEDFLTDMKTKQYNTAVTYYDNPKINLLLPKLSMPSTYTKIDDGKHRTYKAVISLAGDK